MKFCILGEKEDYARIGDNYSFSEAKNVRVSGV